MTTAIAMVPNDALIVAFFLRLYASHQVTLRVFFSSPRPPAAVIIQHLGCSRN